MDVLKIIYTGDTKTIPFFIENGILTCGTTEIDFSTTDTISKLKTELEKINKISAIILNNSGDFETIKINEISREFPADFTKPIFLSYDNYSSPKMICETFNVPYSNVINSWFDSADTLITAQTCGFYFKEVTETINIDTTRKNTRYNDKYSEHHFFGSFYNELYLPEYAPIQKIDSIKINGVSVDPDTVIINYNCIILTSDSEVKHFPLGANKVTLTFTYGYPKNSAYGVMAKQVATYLIFENLYSYVESGGGIKPFKVEHGGLVITEEMGKSVGVTNRVNTRILFKGLPTKMGIAVVK